MWCYEERAVSSCRGRCLEKCPESRFEGPAIDAGEPKDAQENEGGSWSCQARRYRRRPEAREEDPKSRLAFHTIRRFISDFGSVVETETS
jgi:hypothetical protein